MMPYQCPPFPSPAIAAPDGQRSAENVGAKPTGVLPPRSPYMHPPVLYAREYPAVARPMTAPPAASTEALGSLPGKGSGANGGVGFASAGGGAESGRKRRSPAPDTKSQPHAVTARNKKQKARFLWSERLHKEFVRCVFDVGLKSASPKAIVELLPANTGLTSEHVKSHLQKFRMHGPRSRDEFLTQYTQALANSSPDVKLEASTDRNMPSPASMPQTVETIKRQLNALKRTLGASMKLQDELQSSIATQQLLCNQLEAKLAALDPTCSLSRDEHRTTTPPTVSAPVEFKQFPAPAPPSIATTPAVGQWTTTMHARPQQSMMMPPALQHPYSVLGTDSYSPAPRYNEHSQLQLEMQIGMNMHRQLLQHKEGQVAPYQPTTQQPDQLSISAYTTSQDFGGNQHSSMFHTLTGSPPTESGAGENMGDLDIFSDDDLFSFLVEQNPPPSNSAPLSSGNDELDVVPAEGGES